MFCCRGVSDEFPLSLMFFVFVPPSVTNHPSQTFAKIQRFYNHLCSFFLIQDSFDLECCCVALCCVSRALTHKSHKLCCCDAPATPEFIITGSFAARPDLVKRSVCVCWLFRNVRSYCSPPDLVVPSRLRIHPENVCGAEAIVSRSPLTHSSVNASVCVCCF